MNKPEIQKIFIQGEIGYRKEKGFDKGYRKRDQEKDKNFNGEYLSMGNKNTSIILADTQVLEKCINLLKDGSDPDEVVALLEAEIEDIEQLEKELESGPEVSEIQVDKIIIGS
jgi:hypothetical protein